MPRVTTARIERAAGEAFQAEIANITVRTLFAKTEQNLRFRERIRVTLFDFVFDGEVAFVSAARPRGVVISFSAPPVLQAAIAERVDDFEVIDSETYPGESIAEEWVETTTPNISPELVEEIPQPLEVDIIATLPPDGDTDAGFSAAVIDLASNPVLDRDGVTIQFASREHYRAQYKANIAHGGIVVAADAVPIGAQRFVAIQVPGLDKYTISVRATYNGPGTVGFTIDAFSLHKVKLAELAGD